MVSEQNTTWTHRLLQPTRALLALSVLVPMLLLAFIGWQSYADARRTVLSSVERNSRVLHEHAVKVFETHKLVIDAVNVRIATLDLKNPADGAELHSLLKRFQDEFDQVATITITDGDGHLINSSRNFPVDSNVTFTDRDWFQALKAEDLKRPYVSKSYTGRQSGQSVFNIAARIRGRDPSQFVGVIAVSVDRTYFENFYNDIDPSYPSYVVLFRQDGEILAQQPAMTSLKFPNAAAIAANVAASPRRFAMSPFIIDDESQIAGFRMMVDYPVVVGFSISQSTAFEAWVKDFAIYAAVAFFAMLCLLAVSGLALRQGHRWRLTADSLAAEAKQRSIVESQLRQAQKMEAVGRLTGGVAHDFNNLLTVVIGSLDLLSRRIDEGNERARTLVRNALEASNRAASLTARLLAFSRQQPLAPSMVDVNKLIAGMSDLLQRTLGEQIEIEVVQSGGLWPAHADPNQLESAVLNLCVNARDAMPDGGKLTIETSNSHLDDAYAKSSSDLKAGQYVCMSISDTGSGMSTETRANAFEPFFTTKPVGQGTGLGLSQVYGFAKQSGGHASIYSEIGEGTTVKIYLLRHRGPADAPVVVSEPKEIPKQADGQLVLLVEDEAAVREFAATALREAGYRVIEAANANRALELVAEHGDLALLFTDVVLTGSINGRLLAEKAKELRPNLPVLFTTGYTRNAIIHHGRLDEGIDFIGKPFTAQAVSAKVGEVIAGA